MKLFPVGPNARNWTTLEDYYAGETQCVLQRHFMSAKVGWINFQSCVCIGVSPAGLSLSIDGPFNIAQPDSNLLVPWSQIKLLGRDCLHLGLWLYFKKARTKVWIGIGLFGGGDILREVEKHLVADEE